MSINAGLQYNTIISALNSKGCRLIYDGKSFQKVSTSDAKKFANKDGYIADLPHLKGKIEEFVKNNPIEDISSLKAAFTKRADRLADRFVLFGGSKRDVAVANLRQIPPAIDAAARSAISKKVPASSRGPQGGVALPGLSHEAANSSTETAPAQSRPLAPPANAPLPPPPPGMGKKPVNPVSHTHKKLIIEADKLGTFKGEPKRPDIAKGHDLGKPSQISAEDRAKYAEKIDRFLYGTPYTAPVKKGLKIVKEKRREENGLQHTLNRIQKELEPYAKEVDRLGGLRQQMHATKDRIDVLEKRIKEMNEANAQSQFYILYTTAQSAPDKSVAYIPDREHANLMTKINELSSEDRKILESANSIPPKELKISSKVQEYTDELVELKSSQKEYERQIFEIEKTINARLAKNENGIPFSDWQSLYRKKTDLIISWKSVLDNLMKGAAATDEPASNESQSKERLNELHQQLPLTQMYHLTFNSVSMQVQAQSIKKWPKPARNRSGRKIEKSCAGAAHRGSELFLNDCKLRQQLKGRPL